MKLQEAIEINEDNKDFLESGGYLECAEATQLGIEALKRIKACREPEGGNPLPPLSGETNE